MKIEYGEITIKKITNKVWLACVETTKPMKATVEMQGTSEDNARSKLQDFLEDESIGENELKVLNSFS